MGHRTLTLGLVLRALFLDSEAFDEVRDDDNPFVEGLFLLVLMGLVTAALTLIGQLIAWGSVPQVSSIREVVMTALQQQPWWSSLNADPQASSTFQTLWDGLWRALPPLFGAPDPAMSALNLLVWPVWLVASWLIYAALAHGFARWLGGAGAFGGVLGATALSFTPILFRGLGIVPFIALGGALNTWQLILRYKAIRSAHGLTWGRALAATLLPYAVYLVLGLLAGGAALLFISLLAGR